MQSCQHASRTLPTVTQMDKTQLHLLIFIFIILSEVGHLFKLFYLLKNYIYFPFCEYSVYLSGLFNQINNLSFTLMNLQTFYVYVRDWPLVYVSSSKYFCLVVIFFFNMGNFFHQRTFFLIIFFSLFQCDILFKLQKEINNALHKTSVFILGGNSFNAFGFL